MAPDEVVAQAGLVGWRAVREGVPVVCDQSPGPGRVEDLEEAVARPVACRAARVMPADLVVGVAEHRLYAPATCPAATRRNFTRP